MNEDRINEAGLDELAGYPPPRERRTATDAGVVSIVAAVALGLALHAMAQLEAHLEQDERNAAVPTHPRFGRGR